MRLNQRAGLGGLLLEDGVYGQGDEHGSAGAHQCDELRSALVVAEVDVT